ncbi:MAG: DNA helicase [Halobacteriovorax sp.]|nr:DNA helicase [Halobacteriovorax sp.]|tara:strand:- start:337851 stop:340433 length:2583 start_codon:yes stop_codon:yes gene_type:complete
MGDVKEYQIFLKGEDKTNSVSRFEKIGSKYKIVFNSGKTFTYNARNVQIIESVLKQEKPRDVFDYLSKIASKVGLKAKVGDGKEINILSHNFSKLGFIDKDSLLGHFLSKSGPNVKSETQIKQEIYPFGFNSSQKKAVDRALKNRVSIIEGPPGTGKTQTILNLIANIVSNGQSVAVVSSNNSATKNVLEKLEKNDVCFISAYLGNTSNKKDFIETQSDTPNLKEWELSAEDIEKLNDEISTKYTELEEKLEKQIKLSELKQEYSGIVLEERHFLIDYEKVKNQDNVNFLDKVTTSDRALELWLESENFEKPSWFWSIVYFVFSFMNKAAFRHSFINKLSKEYSVEFLVSEFQKRFYELKKNELGKRIDSISRELERFDFSKKMKVYSEMSLKLFKSSLADKYKDGRSKEYEIEDLRKDSESFIKDYPVILSTTYSLRSSLSRDVTYDYVIVDESSQVDLCTGALALSCAKNIVVVGDLKQLPHVVDSRTANLTDSIFESYDLSESFRYKDQSLLSSLIEIFPEAPRTLLREHYRCHPKIIEFCNKKFYDGKLVVLTEDNGDREPLVVYKTVEGNHARNRVNKRQIDVIKNEIVPEQKLNLNDGSLGIITPYRNQTNVLQDSFKGTKVKADTVDKFQGQENDIVILSTVDNEVSEFTDDANRLNVAVSRAVKQLILIVNEGDSLEDRNIGDLVNYIEYNNFSVIKSKISSVFDYLFKSYAKKRREFFKGKKKVSRFDSENLMYDLLSNILREKNIRDLGIAMHVPLKMIINDSSLLDSEEERFVMKTQSHVDFLIYDSLGKKPKFAIEVDGVSYHKDSGRQAERDKMKDEIFKKYELPLYRFRTDDSNEKQRIAKILDSI